MALAALLIAASAGWQAKVHFTHDPPRRSGGADGAIHVSGGRARVEEPTPMGLTVILSAEGKVRLLFPDKRQFMEVAARDAALATAPPLSLAGMKQVGEERIDGRDCAIWERAVETQAGRIHQRLWVPAEAKKQLLFLRFVTQTARGATRADVSELREVPQPEALFRVPRGYTKK